MAADKQQAISAGVDELIARLRQDGIDAGRQQAEAMLAEARQQAAAIVAAARDEARQQQQASAEQLARDQQSAQDALQIAFRDLVLDMKGMLANRFSADVSRLVREQVSRPELLEKLILAAVGRLRQQADIPDAAEIDVLLPPRAPGLADIRQAPEQARQGAIADLAFALQGDLLREGVTFASRDGVGGGIHLILRNERIEVDMSDAAIAALLLDYLQPRFRAILDGIIR